MIKKISLVVAGILVILIIWKLDLIIYGLEQAKGQLHIVWNARPVEEYLSDPGVPDSVKQKLRFVQEVRKYAVQKLGLNDSENYTAMYDQKGKPVLWVVTGCAPYAFEPKEWHFPIVGTMPYKGFFNKEDAMETMEALQEQGYDAGVRTVGGWSTLGWFNDPILSNMLYRSTGELANLIIHELVHATIFVKDSVDFNENLASFIGDHGTYMFLRDHFGKASEVYQDYLKQEMDEQRYTAHILRGADSLEVLYSSFQNVNVEEVQREEQKQQLIRKIMNEIDTLTLNNENYLEDLRGYHPNNTFFMSFMLYRSKQDELELLYHTKFNSDLKEFINYMKEKYPFL